MDFPLGRGLIHNDAHVGNLLVDSERATGYVLADWDGTGRGPREIDLVQEGAPGNRFGESLELRAAFSTAYGYDIAGWAGWPVLRVLRDLHSVGAYLRVAPDKPAARAELAHRMRTRRTGEPARWHGIE